MSFKRLPLALWFLWFSVVAGVLHAADYPEVVQHDFVMRDFKFQSGETIAELRIHYRTVGAPRRNTDGVVSNAILILHGTTGQGGNFIRNEFAGELFGAGQPLDATRYYVIMPDSIGHGQSSKPSDGQAGDFPHYGYHDMVDAQYRLVTEGLNVGHLRLVMGTSMGGMHTWVWGETHPDFMDALLPLACLPTEISGRNRVWRRMIIDAIRNDPGWRNGHYESQPQALRTAAEVLFFMASNPVQRQSEAPTLKAADALLDNYVAGAMTNLDANNVLYAVESSRDYDPGPALGRIRARVLAINFADDLINPPELGILEREIKRVPRGQAIVMPMSARTRGHGTHTLAAVWKDRLAKLLDDSAPRK